MTEEQITDLQTRVRLQTQMLRALWKGFKPFEHLIKNWVSDLEKVVSVPVDCHEEDALVRASKQDPLKLERVCSRRAVMDVADMLKQPEKVVEMIDDLGKELVQEVALQVEVQKRAALTVSPLNVAVKAENFVVEFYFYALMLGGID